MKKQSILSISASLLLLAGCADYGDSTSISLFTSRSDYELDSENLNANAFSSVDYTEDLETPHLNSTNTFITHTTTSGDSEILTMSIEWNTQMKHSSWVSFYFDEKNMEKNVERSNNFAEDPEMTSAMGGASLADHISNGYDRGHLCASSDRLWCSEANNQTFYLTNMSPQIPSFNQGFWEKCEEEIRTLAANAISEGYEKVYVTKGGDLNHLLKNFKAKTAQSNNVYATSDASGFTSKGLAVPAYYFTVLLAEKTDGDDFSYKVLGLYVPHSEDLPSKPTTSQIQKYVYSIDYIEEQTGIDFFCNLKDSFEDSVEAEDAASDISSWTW